MRSCPEGLPLMRLPYPYMYNIMKYCRESPAIKSDRTVVWRISQQGVPRLFGCYLALRLPLAFRQILSLILFTCCIIKAVCTQQGVPDTDMLPEFPRSIATQNPHTNKLRHGRKLVFQILKLEHLFINKKQYMLLNLNYLDCVTCLLIIDIANNFKIT